MSEISKVIAFYEGDNMVPLFVKWQSETGGETAEEFILTYHGCYQSRAGFAREFLADVYPNTTGWIGHFVDWTAVADSLENDFGYAFIRLDDGIHVFIS